jgi:hypothetical protein
LSHPPYVNKSHVHILFLITLKCVCYDCILVSLVSSCVTRLFVCNFFFYWYFICIFTLIVFFFVIKCFNYSTLRKNVAKCRGIWWCGFQFSCRVLSLSFGVRFLSSLSILPHIILSFVGVSWISFLRWVKRFLLVILEFFTSLLYLFGEWLVWWGCLVWWGRLVLWVLAGLRLFCYLLRSFFVTWVLLSSFVFPRITSLHPVIMSFDLCLIFLSVLWPSP